MAAQPPTIDNPSVAEAFLPFQPVVITEADLDNELSYDDFDEEAVEPDPGVIWCKEEDGRLYPYPNGEWPNPTTTSDFLCEVINGVPYPFEVGGEPVTHGDPHFMTLVRAANMTQRLLSSRPGAKLFSDMFMFWDEDNPVKKCAPDLYVFPQLERRDEDILSVRVWEEVSSPIFVMELISKYTAKEDTGPKFKIYRDEIKIPEYLQCDLRKRPFKFKGFRLENGKYIRLKRDKQGRIWSEQLQAWFGRNEDGEFQVWDATGHPLPDYEEATETLERVIAFGREQAARAEQESQRAQQESQRAQQEGQRAQQEGQRAQQEGQRAQQESQRAQQESQRAQQEETLRHLAEARVRQLEEELQRRNG